MITGNYQTHDAFSRKNPHSSIPQNKYKSKQEINYQTETLSEITLPLLKNQISKISN